MDLNSVPRLAAGCRVHPTQPVLLVPEGTLQLTGSARDVLTRIDGHTNIATIVGGLLHDFEGADEQQMQADVLDLLDRLQQRGVVRA